MKNEATPETPDTVAETSNGRVVPFDSLRALADSHTELLRRELSSENTLDSSFLADVRELIERGRATGAVLDSVSERRTAQSLMNYWVTVLYRAGQEGLGNAILVPYAEPERFDQATAQYPYVGLSPFTEADQDRFYGRLGVTTRLIKRLEENRLAIFVGPAGSGKTSVVNAGVIPQLKTGKKTLAGEQWQYFDPVMPGREPLKVLAGLLDAGNGSAAAPTPPPEELFSDPTYLAQQLKQKFPDRSTLLVVDRFEEVFTLCKNHTQQDAFIANLINLTQTSEPSGPAHRVILVIRSDRTNYIIQRPDLKDLYPTAEIRIHTLRESDLREAIKEPARKIGLKYEAGIVAQLVREIYGDLAGLPLLQFTLLKLWEEKQGDTVTWTAMRQLKSCAYALIQTAQAWYDSLTQAEKETARLVLLKMVRITDNLEVVGDRVRREELYQSGASVECINGILESLLKYRLVRLSRGTGPVSQTDPQTALAGSHEMPLDDQFQLIHESMWRDWEVFTAWLKELRTALVTRQRLESLTVNWVMLGRSDSGLLDKYQIKEARTWMNSPQAAVLGYDSDLAALVQLSNSSVSKQKLYKSAWLAFTSLLFLGLVFGWFWQYRAKQRVKLEDERRKSESAFRVASLLERMASENPADRLSALSEMDSLVSEGKMPPKIGAVILQIAIRDRDEQVADKADEVLKQVSQTRDKFAQSINSAAYGDATFAKKLNEADMATPRFYIHLATRDQEGRADALKKVLEEKGYIVPPFVIVGGSAPPTNQVRYNKQSDSAEPSPDSIVALLNAIDNSRWSNPLRTDQLEPGTFQIWLAGQFARTGRLVIRLTDSDGNDLNADDLNFELFISSLSNPEQRSFRSSSGLVYPLLPGKYNLTVKARGYRRANRAFPIKEGTEVVVDLALRQ